MSAVRTGARLTAFCALLLAHPAHAACTSPTGAEGDMMYNAASNVMQGCNGTGWIALGEINPAAGPGTCSNPTGNEADILYNKDFSVFQFCNGQQWTAMTGGSGAGSSGNASTCPSDSGLVARWTMEEGSGTTTTDSVGSYVGTLTNGPTWATGHSGNGINFDGTNDYVNVPVNAALNMTGTDMTISAWFKADVATGTRRIVSLPKSETAGSEKYALLITGGQLQFALGKGSEAFAQTPFSDTTSWHHVVGVLDERGDSVMLFLDGVYKTVALIGTGNIGSNTNGNFQIGRYGPTYGQYFDGQIDDVRVYNRALSDAEIASLYAGCN